MGIVTLLGKFIKSQKVSSDELNFKTNGLGLLSKDYLNILRLFPVACRYGYGMDGNRLKLENIR